MFKLGLWQLERLEWKNVILADIEAQENIDPMQTPLDLKTADNFAIGYVDGTAAIDVIFIQPRTYDGEVGKHVYSVIKTKDGQNLVVNYGWLPMDAEGVLNDLHTGRFFGYLQKPDKPNAFTPPNNVSENRWYAYDEETFKDHYNLNAVHHSVLYAITPAPGSDIQPFDELPRPRNKHAQYAAFWFGMCGLLLFLSGFYIYKQRKKKGL